MTPPWRDRLGGNACGHTLAILYAAWALPLLITLAIVTPPWTVTDEPFHMLRAVQVAHGGIIGHRITERAAGGLTDPVIYGAFNPMLPVAFDPAVHVTNEQLRASGAIKWSRQATAGAFGNTVQYAPFFYIPDAVAYWLGRACRLHINPTLLLARLCNAMVYAALSALAIATARRTRCLLTAVLMLPMSVTLGASANQDAVLIPLTALVVARLDQIIAEAREPRTLELWGLAAGLAMIGMARPPYAAFTLLLLQTGKPQRATWIAACSACVAILAWCALMANYTMVPIGPSDPSAQLRNLLAHPAFIASVAGNTLAQSGTYAWEFIGRLAWNDRPLPAPYLALAGTVLGLAALAGMTGNLRRPAYSLLAAGFAVCTILILQYLDWTPVGSDHVAGVVGRYFIPLVLVLALALPSAKRLAATRRFASRAGLVVLALVTPGTIMQHVAMRYYIQ